VYDLLLPEAERSEKSLLASPLTLSMMLSIMKHEGSLPKNSIKLYNLGLRGMVNVLARKVWSNATRTMDVDRVLMLLHTIALALHLKKLKQFSPDDVLLLLLKDASVCISDWFALKRNILEGRLPMITMTGVDKMIFSHLCAPVFVLRRVRLTIEPLAEHFRSILLLRSLFAA
jgi:hypothetical protein